MNEKKNVSFDLKNDPVEYTKKVDDIGLPRIFLHCFVFFHDPEVLSTFHQILILGNIWRWCEVYGGSYACTKKLSDMLQIPVSKVKYYIAVLKERELIYTKEFHDNGEDSVWAIHPKLIEKIKIEGLYDKTHL